MKSAQGSIEMPIATVVMAILVLIYIFLLAVGRAGTCLRTFCVRRGQGTGRGRNAALTESADTGSRFPA